MAFLPSLSRPTLWVHLEVPSTAYTQTTFLPRLLLVMGDMGVLVYLETQVPRWKILLLSPTYISGLIPSSLYPVLALGRKAHRPCWLNKANFLTFSLSPSRALWGNVSSRALNKAGILGDACLILPSTRVVGYFWGWKFRNETLFLWVSMVTLCDTGKHLGAAGISGKQERGNLN